MTTNPDDERKESAVVKVARAAVRMSIAWFDPNGTDRDLRDMLFELLDAADDLRLTPAEVKEIVEEALGQEGS